MPFSARLGLAPLLLRGGARPLLKRVEKPAVIRGCLAHEAIHRRDATNCLHCGPYDYALPTGHQGVERILEGSRCRRYEPQN